MRKSSFLVIVLLAAVTVLSTSCSKLPTAPNALEAPGRDGGSAAIVQIEDPPAPAESGPGMSTTITLNVGEEGAIQAGNFTLKIHKHSLKQTATITVIQPDPNVMDVEFEVSPAEANDFQVPVQIVADCSENTLADVLDQTMYLWNGLWEEASAVSLDHASRHITTHVHELRNGKIMLRGKGVSKRVAN